MSGASFVSVVARRARAYPDDLVLVAKVAATADPSEHRSGLTSARGCAGCWAGRRPRRGCPIGAQEHPAADQEQFADSMTSPRDRP